jgi:hypothetical protein
MKFLKDELDQRWKEHRQNAVGTWSGLIVKIALLLVVIYLLVNTGNRNFTKISHFFGHHSNPIVNEGVKE